jgi:hypothetical protein
VKEIEIAVLDNDFIGKCHKMSLGESCLLERFFDTSIEKAVCHEAILKECAQGQPDSSEYHFLLKMIDMGKIQIKSDIELMTDDTQVSIREFLFTYSKILSLLFPHKQKILDTFYQVFSKMESFKTRQQVVSELQIVEDIIENHYGEFKTCILISYMLELSQKKVFYFCSDDKGAHSLITSMYGDSVKAIKPYAVIVYCFNNNFLTQEEAQSTMKSSKAIGAVKYREKNNKVAYCTAEVFLEYLFSNTLSCSSFGDAQLVPERIPGF